MRTDIKTGGKLGRAIVIVAAVLTLALGCIAFTGCGYCAHELEVKDEKVPSTCIEHGHSYTYECKKCKKLFAYTAEKGLYEVNGPEELPLSRHTLPDIKDGQNKEFGARLKEGITEPTSLFDFEMITKCALCEAEFAVPEKNLVYLVPPQFIKNNSADTRVYNGKRYYDEENERWYTSIELGKNTRSSDIIEINPYGKQNPNQSSSPALDPGWNYAQGATQSLPLYIPFNSSDEPRYLVYMIHNTHDSVTVKVEWNIDGNNWGSATVAPGEYKPLVVKGSRGTTNVDAQYMRVSNADGSATLGAKMTIEMSGFFYTAGKVEKLDVRGQAEKLEYTAGEMFDTKGLNIYATYTDQFLGKMLRLADCKIDVLGRPLTEKDTKVVVSYGGKSVSFSITVNKEGA